MLEVKVPEIPEFYLTRLECETLAFLAAGYTRKELANIYSVSYGAIALRLHGILNKMNCLSIEQAIYRAVKERIIK